MCENEKLLVTIIIFSPTNIFTTLCFYMIIILKSGDCVINGSLHDGLTTHVSSLNCKDMYMYTANSNEKIGRVFAINLET